MPQFIFQYSQASYRRLVGRPSFNIPESIVLATSEVLFTSSSSNVIIVLYAGKGEVRLTAPQAADNTVISAFQLCFTLLSKR